MENNTTTSAPLIYKAMADIMDEVGVIGKNKRNEQQKYQFRGIDDMYNVLHPLFKKHKIIISPTVLDSKREERKTSSGGTLIYSIVRIQFRFYATDGSYVESVAEGEGMDSGDKSTNKAASAALKYMLMQTFLIPTEDMTDADADSPNPLPRTQQQAPPPAPAAGKQQTPPPAAKAAQPAKTNGINEPAPNTPPIRDERYYKDLKGDVELLTQLIDDPKATVAELRNLANCNIKFFQSNPEMGERIKARLRDLAPKPAAAATA